jgi:hypothetical protein
MRGVAWTCAGLGIAWSALLLTTAATKLDYAIWSSTLITSVAVLLVLWRHRTVGTSRIAAWALVVTLLLLGYPLGVLYLILVAPIALLLAVATAVAPGPARA